MKATASQLVAAAAILSIADALKSSVRGGAKSDAVDRFVLDSTLPERRFLHRNSREDSQPQRRAQDKTEYWWLSKTSSEKDVVYKPADEAGNEGESASNGKDSFSVFTIGIDNNPDTSELPYRAPSREPTPHPTPVPTETITIILSTTDSTVQLAPPVDAVNVQLAPPQNHESSIAPQDIKSYNPPQDIIDIVGYAEQLDGTAYHFPIWTDTFKGCTSSATVPGAYISFADEYIFSSIDSCCKEWFNSGDCSGDGMIIMSSSEENLDEYMFRMNGPEAYSEGGSSSEDYSSNDNPPPPTPSEFVTGPPISTTVTLPPIGFGSGTPTYHPTSGDSAVVDITGNETGVIPVTYPPIGSGSGSTSPPVVSGSIPPVSSGSTSPPVVSVGTPAPSPTVVDANYTPYPTFSALAVVPTPPPVFLVGVSTPAPSVAGSGGGGGGSIEPTFVVSIVAGTAPPVASQGTNPPVSISSSFPTFAGSGNDVSGGTQWPTFSDVSPQPSSGGTSSGTVAGSSSSTSTSTLAGTSNSTAAGSASSTSTSTLESTSNSTAAGSSSSTSTSTLAGTSNSTAAGSSSSTSTSTLESTGASTLEGTDDQNVTLRASTIEEVSKGTRLFMSHTKRHSDD